MIEHSGRAGVLLTATGLLCCLIVQSSAAQPLSVGRLRAVTCKYGPLRQGNRIQPHENLVLLYDINGAKVDESGNVSIDLKMVWTAADGREVGTVTNNLNVVHVFGGSVMGFGSLNYPEAVPAGIYTLNLTVEDKLAGAATQAKYAVELTKPTFDIVNTRFVLGSAEGPERPNRFYVYDPMYILLDAVGFSVAGGKVLLSMDVEVQEATGKALHSFKDMVKLDDKFPEGGQHTATFSLALNLTRPGQFVAVITIKDGSNGQSVSKKVPFVVEAAN